MKFARRGWQRVKGFFLRGRRDAELAEELASHIEMQVEDNLRAGMSEAEARRAARIKFGGLEAAKESYRDQLGLPVVEALLMDVRYAARGLRKTPGFTAVAVLTLAVAIGANTAVFSLVDQILLRPRGIVEPERVVSVRTEYRKVRVGFNGGSLRTMADLQESKDVIEFAAAAVFADANYTGNGAPERLVSASVTADWFDVFGVRPLLGRTFTPESNEPNANREVVLSHGLWVRLYGADPTIVGKSIELNDVPRQIIGVMPPEFREPRRTDVWAAAGVTRQMMAEDARFNENGPVVARLKPGVSVAASNEWMKILMQRVRESSESGQIAREADWHISTIPFVDVNAGETKTQLWVLFGAVGLVALIACANIAGLLLARASARVREFAVRTALGASRGHLVRGILAESALLAAMGGTAGVLLAFLGLDVVLALAPEAAVAGVEARLDGAVLSFTAAATCGAVLLFGMAPVWWLLRRGTPDLSGGRAVTASRGRVEARGVLVIAETALALMLLIAGGLLLRSLVALEGVDPGFETRGVMAAWISPPRTTYPGAGPNAGRRDALFQAIWERLDQAPGVTVAALGSQPPFRGEGNAGNFDIEGRVTDPNQLAPHGSVRQVSAGYFEALGIPLRKGRTFTASDRAGGEPVAVIDEALAREYWPAEDPIGKRIRRDDDAWSRIVGVVGHVLDENLAADSGKGTYYFPLLQRSAPAVSILVKTDGDAASMPAVIREAVRGVDARLPVHTFESMEEVLARSLGARRFGMQLIGFFAGVGLFLAALGLYGVISYTVMQRAREIGIRMALGAEKRQVTGMVVGQGLRLAGIGAALGIAGAAAGTQWLASVLYGVSAFDPLTWAGMVAVVIGAAAVASLIPAGRAVRVDPAVTLRPE